MTTAPISPAKLNILITLARFIILTAAQICQATRSPKGIKETYRQLQPLIDGGYVEYLPTGSPRKGGSPLRAYFLSDQGFRYLVELELVYPRGYRARAIRARSQHHLTHTLESNQLLVLGIQLARILPHISIARMMTEHELKRQPVYVNTPPKGRHPVIPDGFVSFRTPKEQNLVFELDRNTEWLKRPILNKLSAYLAWEKGPYSKAYDTQVLTAIAWVVSQGGEHRAQMLCSATEQVLKQARAEQIADLFKFTALQPSQTNPQQLFYAPIWRQPFVSEEVALLGGGEQLWANPS